MNRMYAYAFLLFITGSFGMLFYTMHKEYEKEAGKTLSPVIDTMSFQKGFTIAMMCFERTQNRQQAVQMFESMQEQLQYLRSSEGFLKDLEQLDRTTREEFWDEHATIIAYMSIACDRIREVKK